MKKQKENAFAKKFRLLSSQESGEINWSSSDSSEFETIIPYNADRVINFSKRKSRKRKRKQTVLKNLSNLDITVIDLTKDQKEATKNITHEIMTVKREAKTEGTTSPTLGSTQYFPPFKYRDAPTSPIITSKTLEYQAELHKALKSPILILKSASPKISPNVRKQLFRVDNLSKNKGNKDVKQSKSLTINEDQCLDRRKYSKTDPVTTKTRINDIVSKTFENPKISLANVLSTVNEKQEESPNGPLITNQTAHTKAEFTDFSKDESSQEICVINETPEVNMDHSMAMLRTSSMDLVQRVKKYFDNDFSSENPSQQTISEISTPKNNSKSSDDVEIINTITQVVSNKNSIESLKQEAETFIDSDNKDKKKIRYKKDGLAYRLNTLLKKQTASISLWQHERYLATNSNFVIPKVEFVAFRICKVSFKYGCHLLKAMDLNDGIFLILINSHNSLHNNFSIDDVIKLYEPYKIVDFNNCKLVINVTKFECVPLNK